MSGARTTRGATGFTLVELLAGMAIFTILMVILLSIVNQANNVWVRARNQVASYQSARFAFDLITRTLSQSTLNVYGDYDDPSNPTRYMRKSDLDFVIRPGTYGSEIFFQAPIAWTKDPSTYARLEGMTGLLNSVGYFVDYGKNNDLPDFLLPYDKEKFRLVQYLESTETLKVYEKPNDEWIPAASTLRTESKVIADNVILLLLWPKLAPEEDPEGDDLTNLGRNNGAYEYDSRYNALNKPQPLTANQQPPLVQVALVAIDTTAANRLNDSGEIDSVLSGLFQNASEETYKNDMATLEDRLNEKRIGYRIFSKTVSLRESKFTR